MKLKSKEIKNNACKRKGCVLTSLPESKLRKKRVNRNDLLTKV